jgi:hypothetical protein
VSCDDKPLYYSLRLARELVGAGVAMHLTAHAFVGRVRTLCDIGGTCRRYGDAIEWSQLIERATLVFSHEDLLLHLAIRGVARRVLLRAALLRFAEASVPVIALKGAALQRSSTSLTR